MADSSHWAEVPPRGRWNVHTSVTSCGIVRLPETTRPELSTVTSISENRMAIVAYSSFPSRQASARSLCRSFGKNMIGKHIRLGNAWSQASRALLRLAIGILLLACTSLTSESCAKFGGDSVDDSRRIKVGGAELYVEIRGLNRSAPLLLWLHGGPGGPERPLFRYFNSDLERRFLVAYLDQRGAGRSFDRAADTTRLT